MSIYYRDSGLTWGQYLQADSFVQDVTGEIKRSGEGIKTAISDQTKKIVASNDALAMEFGVGFDQVNSTLDWGFGRVVSELSELRAEFSYGMGLALEQLRIQQRSLDGILDQLDAIRKVLITPRLTKARELSRDGMENLQKGLLPEALEDLLESAKENRTDFLVQLQIGKLYLYGQNLTDDVIDLPSAENHLRLAARYANSEIQSLPDAAKFCGEAFLHAAISCYAQANEKWLAGDADSARDFTEQALDLSQNATRVYPQFAEAFYNHAKFAALLGDGGTAQSSLKTAILADRNYCIKADADKDFDGVREYVHNLFESLRQQAKKEATKYFEPLKDLLENYVFQSTEAKQAEPEIRKLFGQAEPLYRKDTYFDYLDALPLLKEAQQTFDQIPFVEFTTLTGHSGFVTSVVFSSNGKYLVSGSGDKTVKVYQTDGFKEIVTLTGHSNYVYSVAFSPDGRYLASGSYDKTVKIYQTDGFKEIMALTGHSDRVTSVVFSSDGRYLASGSQDRTVKIYQTDKFKEIATLAGHSGYVTSVAFSPDGRYLASGSQDRTVKIYQTDGFKEIATLKGHSKSVTSVVFSPDGSYLVSGSSDDTVKIWGKAIISRQKFEEQARRRIEAEKEAEQRRKELEEQRKQEAERRRKEEEERRKREAEETARRKREAEQRRKEEVERRRKEQELREYRLKNKLCLECGEKLSFWDKLSGTQYCKRHRT